MFEVTPEERANVRAQVENAGLATIVLHWLLAFTEDLHLTSPRGEVRKATSEYLAELARLCRDLGGAVMVLGSPQQRNLLPGVDRSKPTFPGLGQQIQGQVLLGCGHSPDCHP